MTCAVRNTLIEAFEAAVAGAHPQRILSESVVVEEIRAGRGRVGVVAVGKAAAAFASALEAMWPLAQPPAGIVVTRAGYEVDLQHLRLLTAAHPIADQSSVDAAKEVADFVSGFGEGDLLVVLLSGGGSSLLTWPVEGVSLASVQSVTAQMMAAGADIEALNCVRKHVSRLAGGKLAQLAGGARIVGVALSDVVGDDPSLIASGPVSPDASTLADARRAVEQFCATAPADVFAALDDEINETPKPGNSALARVQLDVAPARLWLGYATAALQKRGFEVRVVGPELAGDAADIAQIMATHAQDAAPERGPIAFLSAGEATAIVRGDGEGGPNAEFCLELARRLEGAPDIWALSCDSDGIDGASDAAGGIVRPGAAARARALGYPLEVALARSDATGWLKRLGDAVIPGPTLTNVNDIRIVLVNPALSDRLGDFA